MTGKTGLLLRIAEVSLEQPDGTIREVLYPSVGGEQTFRDLIREAKLSGGGYRAHVHTHLRASYQGHYRWMVPQGSKRSSSARTTPPTDRSSRRSR